jgi:hypothetical protein
LRQPQFSLGYNHSEYFEREAGVGVETSNHPGVPGTEVQLSVRHGHQAVAFYEAAFGARTCFRFGGTEEAPEVAAQLQVGSTHFWVEDESAEHGNFSPETVGVRPHGCCLSSTIRAQPSTGH